MDKEERATEEMTDEEERELVEAVLDEVDREHAAEQTPETDEKSQATKENGSQDDMTVEAEEPALVQEQTGDQDKQSASDIDIVSMGLGAFIGITVLLVLLVALASGSGSTTTEERLTACEEQIARLNEVHGIVSEGAVDATPDIVTAKPKKEPQAANTPEVIATLEVTEAPKVSATPVATEVPATEAPTPTLSPAQVKYFCEVLMIDTNDSNSPEEWDSPKDCYLYDWDSDDEDKYYQDWLKVAAHPATTSTFLHYLAYRCWHNWDIGRQKDAVKLAKLILAHKNCDDECLGYLSASEYRKVRDLVYDRLLARSEK